MCLKASLPQGCCIAQEPENGFKRLRWPLVSDHALRLFDVAEFNEEFFVAIKNPIAVDSGFYISYQLHARATLSESN